MSEPKISTTAYRYPREHLILALTLLLVLVVIAVTSVATVCLSGIFVVTMVAASYFMTRSQHRTLMSQAARVTRQGAPGLAAIADECAARLQPGPVELFVVGSHVLNAYTFGLSSPKVIVLHAALLEAMDADEMRFIIGHEMGHVRLGHTWLNSLVGGMAGIPSPYVASAILSLAFLWWNRACEFSADRAGLLACGKPAKAISALVQLEAGRDVRSPADMERILRHIETEDDSPLSSLGEVLATHPMTVRRIEALRRYAASAEYRRLQGLVDQNVVSRLSG